MIHIKEDFLDQLKPILKNEDGQSAIEFILTFMFALGLVFVFLNQAINYTAGYLNHYVNFMAARTYLVADSGVNVSSTALNFAASAAEDKFNSYDLPSFGIASTDGSSFEVITPIVGNGLFTGTVSQFTKRLSSLPVIGGGASAQFYSESFLGKEPTRITCYEMVCAAMTGSATSCASLAGGTDFVLFDNGC